MYVGVNANVQYMGVYTHEKNTGLNAGVKNKTVRWLFRKYFINGHYARLLLRVFVCALLVNIRRR